MSSAVFSLVDTALLFADVSSWKHCQASSPHTSPANMAAALFSLNSLFFAANNKSLFYLLNNQKLFSFREKICLFFCFLILLRFSELLDVETLKLSVIS